MALADWADCEHDQDVDTPRHGICNNGCGAWLLYMPFDEREDPLETPAFVVSYYPIEEDPL